MVCFGSWRLPCLLFAANWNYPMLVLCFVKPLANSGNVVLKCIGCPLADFTRLQKPTTMAKTIVVKQLSAKASTYFQKELEGISK